MTGRERRLLRMLCMTASGGYDDGGDKPFDELTWDQVIASTKTGKYKSFNVGDMKELDLGTEGIVHMQIVGIDEDDLADGSGKAPLTFISKELLKTTHRMNPERTPVSAPYTEGTGTIGGWVKSEMRTYLKGTVKHLIPENVRNAIKTVTKYSNIYDTAGTKVVDSVSVDDVWIPSYREIIGLTVFETSGPMYTGLFDGPSSRIKSRNDSANSWWLRSASSSSKFRYVDSNGGNDLYYPYNALAIALGFCL